MNRKYTNLAQRILNNTIKQGDCWCWVLACSDDGYGRMTIRVGGRPSGFWVHRVAWELFKGTRIPDDMTLDHIWPICKHKNCWRPDHLELVSRAENSVRMRKKRRALYRDSVNFSLLSPTITQSQSSI